MRILFIAASIAFSSIPGLSVIASGLGTPPDHKVLFGGVIETFGVLALLILWVNEKRLRRVAKKRITRLAIGLMIFCFLLIFTYIFLFGRCVVTAENRGTAYYPLYLCGEIAKTVSDYGSRKAAIEAVGIAEIVEQIDTLPEEFIITTTIILLLTYTLIFTSLTLAFGLVGFHSGHGLDFQMKGEVPNQQSENAQHE